MDIIKNKNKEFSIVNFNKIMEDNYHYFGGKKFWSEINFGQVKCRLSDLSIDDATFNVISIENIKEAIEKIIDLLVDEIKSNKGKNKANVMFDNYTFYYNDGSYMVGSKWTDGTMEEAINLEIDKIRSSSFKTRIKNYLLKTLICVPHEKIENTIAFLDEVKKTVTKTKKESFPISDVNVLNQVLNKYRYEDSTFFDEAEVKIIGIPELINWELRCESGYHNNDGDFAEYDATFIGPSGTEYYFSTEMNLMGNGWELEAI